MTYIDDFRDHALKINDDKKIQIGLGAINKPGVMILLLVREKDLAGKPVKEEDYERAWFRLSNEETNQTLDYKLINKIDRPEDYQPYVETETEDTPPVHNPLTYVHGRLLLDESGVWVFESYQHCFQERDYPDLVGLLGDLHIKSVQEVNR